MIENACFICAYFVVFCNKIQNLAHAKNSKFNYSHNYFAV